MRFAILVAVLTSAGPPVWAADCPFEPWGSYEGTQLHRAMGGTAYLFVTDRTAIDADGSPRAYHPDDVGRPCGASGAGLDCPANAGYPSADWWPTVLAKDSATGRAFVQPSGEDAGFFVSMTALTDPSNSNERDPARYVDASTVPYLVFPRPFSAASGTGRLGDIGIAHHLGNDRQTPFIVADIGPAEPLGEASVAMFEKLGGDRPNPRTGGGLEAGPTLYLVFPSSVRDRERRWPLSSDQIAAEAERLLAGIGGEATLEACVTRFR